MNTCIQIGLHGTCEYLYLAKENWRDLMPEQLEIKRLPDSLLPHLEPGSFKYYGVERSPVFLGKIMEQFQFSGANIEWICAQLSTAYGALPRLHHANDQYPENIYGEDIHNVNYFVPAIDLDTLITGLDIKNLDVLAMDIEGDEDYLLKMYTWLQKPKFITIETHYANILQLENEEEYNLGARTANLKSLICSQGYKCILEQETNETRESIASGTENNFEIQFLREDISWHSATIS